MNLFYWAMAIKALWKMTFSKKPEDIQAQKELEEHGRMMVENPAKYFGHVAQQTAKVFIFLVVLFAIIMLIAGHYDDKEVMRKAQAERESMQAYQEHRKIAPPEQLCQEDKGGTLSEYPCTPRELEQWKEHDGLAQPCSSTYFFPECGPPTCSSLPSNINISCVVSGEAGRDFPRKPPVAIDSKCYELYEDWQADPSAVNSGQVAIECNN